MQLGDQGDIIITTPELEEGMVEDNTNHGPQMKVLSN